MNVRSYSLVLTSIALLTVGSCSSSKPGYGATCDIADQCGGQTPLCTSAGFCVECTVDTECGNNDDRICGSDGWCGQCSADQDCPPDEPFCADRERGSSCVECRSADDCGAAAPVCTPRGRCELPCTGPADCQDNDRNLCHSDLAVCVECETDDQCGPGDPFCDQDSYRCVECKTAIDCGVASPFCIAGQCEQCVQNTDCGPGGICDGDLECFVGCASNDQCGGDTPYCNPGSGRCVECQEDVQCAEAGAELPVCVESECVECRVAEDCPQDQPFCRDNNQCDSSP